MTSPAEDDFADLANTEPESQPGPAFSSRSPRGQGTGKRRTAKSKLDALQKQLSGEMFQAGAMIGLGLPVTGYYACLESDNFTKAVVQLAAGKPEWIDALERLANIQPGLVIGRTAIGLGAALAVDRGRADPDRQVMTMLGVRAAWEKVTNQESGEPGDLTVAPPPASPYRPV